MNTFRIKELWFSLIILAFLMSGIMTGCGKKLRPGGTISVITPDFFGLGEDIALQLSSNLLNSEIYKKHIIMTSVVNLDDLYETSGFGRTLTESLATRLFHHGFGIVEVRKSTELLIKNNTGELMLTRDARLIATEYPAAAVVVGTYSLTPKTVIVNVRLLDCVTQEIVSVAGIEIQRTQSINALLADSHLADTELSAYER